MRGEGGVCVGGAVAEVLGFRLCFSADLLPVGRTTRQKCDSFRDIYSISLEREYRPRPSLCTHFRALYRSVVSGTQTFHHTKGLCPR